MRTLPHALPAVAGQEADVLGKDGMRYPRTIYHLQQDCAVRLLDLREFCKVCCVITSCICCAGFLTLQLSLHARCQTMSRVSASQATGWLSHFSKKASTRDMANRIWQLAREQAEAAGAPEESVPPASQQHPCCNGYRYLLGLAHVQSLYTLSTQSER